MEGCLDRSPGRTFADPSHRASHSPSQRRERFTVSPRTGAYAPIPTNCRGTLAVLRTKPAVTMPRVEVVLVTAVS